MAVCWICLEGATTKICQCKGDISIAHPRCVAGWISVSGVAKCRFCNHFYNIGVCSKVLMVLNCMRKASELHGEFFEHIHPQ